MGEVRRMDMNPYEMDSGYPDSLSSSPRSRETDSDQRWDAGDSTGGSRVRLMCSYGGKILPRPHDNQLSYVGGDTRILAVDRNIRFASMIGKLSSLWGSSVSFKYQLPNEDLDALVSVTNDEDMENMMAEYDRLQKMGYRFSRLRLFVFAIKPDGGSSQSSLAGSLMEETKRENWFVDALNVGPVSRSETAPQEGPWMNNMPDFLFGLEGGNAIDGDRSSVQRNYVPDQTNSKAVQDVYMGKDLQQQPEVLSAPNSPIIGYSSVDSIASAPARINITSATPQGGSDQADQGINLGRGFEQDSNLRANANSKLTDSGGPVPETGPGPVLKTAPDRPIQKQEQYTTERLPQQQVPIQEFQKLQLRQQQDPIARPVDENAGRRIYSDPVRAVNLLNQEISRPNLVDQAYMPQQHQQIQAQNPAPPEYYMQDQGTGAHFVSQGHWQMQEPGGHSDQHYQPVYFMHAGSHMLQQPMAAVRPMGQPVSGPGGGGGGSYYNTLQRMTAPVQVYSSEAAPLSNPVTTVRAGPGVLRQTVPDPSEPYREPIQIPASVPKGAYAPVPASGPVISDPRILYRQAVPVPMAHSDPYSYQNVMYEPASRQVYYTQAPPAMNPQYQPPPVGLVSAVELQAGSSDMASPEQPKLARVSPPSS